MTGSDDKLLIKTLFGGGTKWLKNGSGGGGDVNGKRGGSENLLGAGNLFPW
jgi:hypothetical protein